MNIFGITLSEGDLWLLGAASVCLAWLVPHRLSIWRDSQSRAATARVQFHAAFAPALARLEAARRHGSTHDVPDVDGFLLAQFETLSAAIHNFMPFVSGEQRVGYHRAWENYCELANDKKVGAMWNAMIISEKEPWSVIEERIHCVLSYAKA